MLVASQIDPGHLWPNDRQPFYLYFAVLLARFSPLPCIFASRESERNPPGWPNVDSDLGECSASLVNVQSPSRRRC